MWIFNYIFKTGLQSKSLYREVETDDKDDNEYCRSVWWFIVKIFYNFLSPFWYKYPDDSFKKTYPTYQCDNDSPVAWPDIEEEYVTDTEHYSDKSWEDQRTFILRQLHNSADIFSADKHTNTHNDKYETPELC